mgnify:CR=1 FL=1
MTAQNIFAIVRVGGRSNSQVICDLTAGAEPGTVFSYGEIGRALASGTDRSYDTVAVRSAAVSATNMLEAVHKRTLQNVRGVGYRVALAKEHMGLASLRQDKASRQIRKALSILRNVRYDEMDENTRKAHEGHLMLTSAIYENQMALDKRMLRAELAIESLLSKKIEA